MNLGLVLVTSGYGDIYPSIMKFLFEKNYFLVGIFMVKVGGN